MSTIFNADKPYEFQAEMCVAERRKCYDLMCCLCIRRNKNFNFQGWEFAESRFKIKFNRQFENDFINFNLWTGTN
jgi:hypothetical protein